MLLGLALDLLIILLVYLVVELVAKRLGATENIMWVIRAIFLVFALIAAVGALRGVRYMPLL